MKIRDINRVLSQRNLGLVLLDTISTCEGDFHLTNIARFLYSHWDEEQQKIPDADIHEDALKYELGGMNELNEVFEKYAWLDVEYEMHPPYEKMGEGDKPEVTEKDDLAEGDKNEQDKEMA